MYRLSGYLSLIYFVALVYGSENSTLEVPIETLVNLTGNNELWTILLRDCEQPSLVCVQNNIYTYLKNTLDETDDLQFTSFLKFTKNNLSYDKIKRSFEFSSNDTKDDPYEGEFPIESMSRSLQDNTAKFLITHDLELALPDSLFPNSVLKISPRGLESSGGALVNLEVVSKEVERAQSDDGVIAKGQRTFKKIRKFINEKIIYAILALLLIVKLLAVKFLFILPLLVGAATAKKLLLKILLFVFPFLHHVFKFCAYYPIQAKFHHHKHLISHIHQIAPHKHHEHDYHDGLEVVGPHGYGPPPIEHHGYHDDYHSDFGDDVSILPDDGTGFPHGLISHRKDPTRDDNEVSPYAQGQPPTRRKPNRPLTSIEIERMLAKAEKEALIKSRLEKEQLRIRDENLRLQDQLNQAIKYQEKLKQQTVYLNKKIPQTKITSSVPYNKPGIGSHPPPLKGSPFEIGTSSLSNGPGIELPAGYIPQHTVPQRPPAQITPAQNSPPLDYKYVEQNHFENQYQASLQNKYDLQPQSSLTQYQASSKTSSPGPVYKPQPNTVEIQKSVEYDLSSKVVGDQNQNVKYSSKKTSDNFEAPKVVQKVISVAKPKLEQEIYQAASITYDKFYSPLLEKIDKILQGLGFNDEPCKERLICSMYKNPTIFSPHSNLLSAELSRDSSELQKPSSTNSAVVRFYKYVQAARDGQDQRDCLRLYPSCPINTEVS